MNILYIIQGTSEWAQPDPNDENHKSQWLVCGSVNRELMLSRLVELTNFTDKLRKLRVEITKSVFDNPWHIKRRDNVAAELKLLEELNVQAFDPNLEPGIMLAYKLLEVPLLEA